MRALMISLPIAWGVLGVLVSSPLALVVLGGIPNAVYLLLVSVATLYLSFRETDPRIRDGPLLATSC
jgi:Cu/Ag efflux pump CusA